MKFLKRRMKLKINSARELSSPKIKFKI